MKTLLMTTTLLVGMASVPAFATRGGEGNNTGCNGQGNPNSPCVPGTTGNGGNGGAGGNASVHNNVRTQATARATASARQAQAQRQTQRQVATGGAATVNVTTGGGGGDVISVPRERQRVPDANAPAIWSNNPCVVGLSGGVAVAGFGASFGAGLEDRDCTRRANAQHLVAMGEREAAREVLCESAEVRAAFARIGQPCMADRVAASAPAPVVVSRPLAAAPATRPAYCATLLMRGMVTDDCR